MADPLIIVAGVTGMLGHRVYRELRQRWPETLGTVRGMDARGFDAMDTEGIRRQLRTWKPAVVVNCIGIVKQRVDDDTGAIECITVNSLLPHVMAETLAEWGGRLIHISTDCVFSGAKGHYAESDLRDAVDLYGKSKALGEPTGANVLTLRTSFIGRELPGRAHTGLLEWYLAQTAATDGYLRAVFSGVTTGVLAGLIVDLIANHPKLSGLYHVAARDAISKYALLSLVRHHFGIEWGLCPQEGEPCDRSLNGTQLARAIGWHAPPWNQMIADLAKESA